MRTILSMLLLMPILSFSQKIIEDKVDDFTNTRSIITDATKVDKSVRFSIVGIITKKNEISDTTTSVSFMFTAGTTTSLREDSKIVLKFNDDSVTEIPYKGSYSIMSSGDLGIIYGFLEEDDINKIKSVGISKARISTSSQNIDLSFNKDSNEKFAKALNLVIERGKVKAKS